MPYALKCELGLCNRESFKEVRVLWPDTGDWEQLALCQPHYDEVIHTLPETSYIVLATRRNYSPKS